MVKIAAETSEASPLVVVYGGSLLGKELARQLREEKLRVRHLESKTEALPIWEKPNYTFIFGDYKVPVEEIGGRVLRIKIKGRPKSESYWLSKSALKIIKEALTSEVEEIEIVGEGMVAAGKPVTTRAFEEILAPVFHKKHKSRGRRFYLNLVVLALTFFLLLPFLSLGVFTLAGFSAVLGSASALRQNNIPRAAGLASKASGYFFQAKRTANAAGVILPIFSQRFYSFLDLGDRSADLVGRMAVLLPNSQRWLGAVLAASQENMDLGKQTEQMRLELEPVSQDLGFIEGQLDQVLTPRMLQVLAFWGFSTERISNYREEIGSWRQMISQAGQILDVADEMIPSQAGQTRNYLVVLQNSAELRPTGGFIGSYALVNFDSGHLSGFKIFDVYTADGQLKGRIQPPDEILHFLGQPSWFMRDANWAPDFPLTAKRLEWFLNKEMGNSVDGVVAVDLGAVQKILKVTGPVTISDQGETVTADNFFEKAEFASEINFFAGSEQKPQFLGQVARALLARLSGGGNLDWLALGQALREAVVQKDVLLYFNSAVAQAVALNNNWSGSIVPGSCAEEKSNCLEIVEANLGANKANYFLKRNIRIDSEVSKAGEIDTTVTVNYKNESPNATWPGGDYKNYLRFLVPIGSKVTNFDLGNKKQASISAVLTEDVLKGLPENRFFVFQTKEQTLGGNGKIVEGMDGYGTLVTIPVQGEGTVRFTYRPPYRLDFSQSLVDFSFKVIKQPGKGADAVDLALDYPSFLTPVWDDRLKDRDVFVLALPQKLVYNMESSQDREIKVKFRRQ